MWDSIETKLRVEAICPWWVEDGDTHLRGIHICTNEKYTLASFKEMHCSNDHNTRASKANILTLKLLVVSLARPSWHCFVHVDLFKAYI